ncbi:hypothetical protein D5085_15500 [Ectothiorhodospiraceae bacterium BW-2]|nr:hypothetical protein D5085_15500 [Ectothiorhodospiraceae bacterium BW-2]
MPLLTEQKLITAILPVGRAAPIIEKLVYDKGVSRVNIHHGRGVGRITPLRHRGVGETTEKDTLSVVVAATEADRLFEYLFFEADINRPHGGLIYMQPLLGATPFELPPLEEESR